MADIEVSRVSDAPSGDLFRVRVTEGSASSEHEVRVDAPPPRAAERYPSLEAYVRACFSFLLQRERKESILPSFEVRAIGRYFPEWERELGDG